MVVAKEMSVDDCRDVCHCRPMCMPYMIKQTDAVDDDGARVLELMGELSDPRHNVTDADPPVAHRRA